VSKKNINFADIKVFYMMHVKKTIGTFMLTIAFTFAKAQSDSLDFLRSTGKIYSVVVGIVLILLGLFLYMIRIDNKLTKIEKHINNE
jgi:hypothetical protein